MTNSWRSSALEALAALALAALAGCGERDAAADLASGREAYGKRDFARADKIFTRCVEAGDGADACFWLARVKLDLGALAAAKSLAAEAAKLAPKDADVLDLQAQIAYHEKDYPAAIGWYARIADDEWATVEWRARAWAGIGVVEMDGENRDDSARVAFLKALKFNGRDAAARYHLAKLYHERYHYLAAALEQYEIYVRLEQFASPRVQKVQNRTIPEIKRQLGMELQRLVGRSARDEKACAEALSKAEAAKRKNTFKTARLRYEDALKADPLSFEAARGLAETEMKVDGSEAGQRRALDLYLLACQLRASAIPTFVAAGNLALRLHNNATAVNVFSKTLAASPTRLEAVDGLIRALQAVGGHSAQAKIYQGYRDFLKNFKR